MLRQRERGSSNPHGGDPYGGGHFGVGYNKKNHGYRFDRKTLHRLMYDLQNMMSGAYRSICGGSDKPMTRRLGNNRGTGGGGGGMSFNLNGPAAWCMISLFLLGVLGCLYGGYYMIFGARDTSSPYKELYATEPFEPQNSIILSKGNEMAPRASSQMKRKVNQAFDALKEEEMSNFEGILDQLVVMCESELNFDFDVHARVTFHGEMNHMFSYINTHGRVTHVEKENIGLGNDGTLFDVTTPQMNKDHADFQYSKCSVITAIYELSEDETRVTNNDNIHYRNNDEKEDDDMLKHHETYDEFITRLEKDMSNKHVKEGSAHVIKKILDVYQNDKDNTHNDDWKIEYYIHYGMEHYCSDIMTYMVETQPMHMQSLNTDIRRYLHDELGISGSSGTGQSKKIINDNYHIMVNKESGKLQVYDLDHGTKYFYTGGEDGKDRYGNMNDYMMCPFLDHLKYYASASRSGDSGSARASGLGSWLGKNKKEKSYKERINRILNDLKEGHFTAYHVHLKILLNEKCPGINMNLENEVARNDFGGHLNDLISYIVSSSDDGDRGDTSYHGLGSTQHNPYVVISDTGHILHKERAEQYGIHGKKMIPCDLINDMIKYYGDTDHEMDNEDRFALDIDEMESNLQYMKDMDDIREEIEDVQEHARIKSMNPKNDVHHLTTHYDEHDRYKFNILLKYVLDAYHPDIFNDISNQEGTLSATERRNNLEDAISIAIKSISTEERRDDLHRSKMENSKFIIHRGNGYIFAKTLDQIKEDQNDVYIVSPLLDEVQRVIFLVNDKYTDDRTNKVDYNKYYAGNDDRSYANIEKDANNAHIDASDIYDLFDATLHDKDGIARTHLINGLIDKYVSSTVDEIIKNEHNINKNNKDTELNKYIFMSKLKDHANELYTQAIKHKHLPDTLNKVFINTQGNYVMSNVDEEDSVYLNQGMRLCPLANVIVKYIKTLYPKENSKSNKSKDKEYDEYMNSRYHDYYTQDEEDNNNDGYGHGSDYYHGIKSEGGDDDGNKEYTQDNIVKYLVEHIRLNDISSFHMDFQYLLNKECPNDYVLHHLSESHYHRLSSQVFLFMEQMYKDTKKSGNAAGAPSISSPGYNDHGVLMDLDHPSAGSRANNIPCPYFVNLIKGLQKKISKTRMD